MCPSRGEVQVCSLQLERHDCNDDKGLVSQTQMNDESTAGLEFNGIDRAVIKLGSLIYDKIEYTSDAVIATQTLHG